MPIPQIALFPDGRLKLVVLFKVGKNFWVLDNDTFSWVPSKDELILINEGLEAIDSYNIYKRNLKGRFDRN